MPAVVWGDFGEKWAKKAPLPVSRTRSRPSRDLPPVDTVQAVEVNGHVSSETLKEIVWGGARIKLGNGVLKKVKESHDFLKSLLAEKRLVYGVTTGVGPLSGTFLSPALIPTIQRNIVYTCAAGTGDPFAEDEARATTLVRLLNLSVGVSGCTEALIKTLVAFLNAGLAPCIPSFGSVGASGDLVPLAHLALCLMGEGQCLSKDGIVPSGPQLDKHRVQPFQPRDKDTVALLNGTAAMTGVALINQWKAEGLFSWGLRLSLAICEVLHAKAVAFDPIVGTYRPHAGQKWALEQLSRLCADSERLIQDEGPPPLLPEEVFLNGLLPKQQCTLDPYSLRCVPQLYGAAKDALDYHARLVETEANSATDNPLFVAEKRQIVEAGNFFGQHVANASDALGQSLIQLGVHADRMIARLIEPGRNRGFSVFLQSDPDRVTNGFIGIQITATSLAGEMRCLCVPASVMSIDTAGGVQDINTMGPAAARKTSKLLSLLSRLFAIEAICVAQAMDITGLAGYSQSTRQLYDFVRRKVDFMVEDAPIYQGIDDITNDIWSSVKTV